MYKKFRIFFLFLMGSPHLIWCYLTWVNKYAKHKEKYPFSIRYAKVKKLSEYIVKKLKVDLNVNNLETFTQFNSPFLSISNHRNILDPIFYIYLSKFPISFVAKKETKTVPYLGKVMQAFDCFFIDREDILSQVRLFKEITNRLKVGDVAYHIFPEGTRLKDFTKIKTLPFKDGSLKLAYWSNIDVVYSVNYGTEKLFNKKPKGVKKRKVYINFINRLKYGDFKDKKTIEIMPIIENQINDSLINLANKSNNN